ncbi:MAG TPA: transposase [Phycisphaerae bacterium]|nr:transposase [Phycisphaerae bacterium]HRW54829.1 transposase [Phycisphaerae bacterium]
MARYTADEAHAYFCTITVLDWIPVFIDERYISPVIDSLEFTRKNKGMQLFAYVVMPNHLHLIAASDDLHAHLRDLKRFTSRTIHDLLKADGRTTILDWLDRAAQTARRTRGEFSFWSDGFHPQAIWSHDVFDQKLRYLHANPVRKGLVATPEAWRFSSAGYYNGEREPLIRMDRWYS